MGNHNSLNDLSDAVTPHSAQSDITSILVDESHSLLLERLSVVVTQSVDKVKIVDVTVELLKDAFGWVHNPEYDLQKGSMKNNFVLVETTMLNSIWNTYHDEVNKAPQWCYDFANILQELDKKMWVTNLDGREPKSKIIAFLKTSVLTKADKDRLSDMRKSKISDEDCDSMSSEDNNYFD